jgi:hypothetical protein
MKRLYLTIGAVFILFLFFVSCYYDNEEALYPTLSSSCDTTNVSFSGTIVPILSDNCYSCHSNSTAAASGNNVRLENYADVASNALRIQGSIKHLGSYSAMPKNGGTLKPCSITQFDIWIRNGMPNN